MVKTKHTKPDPGEPLVPHALEAIAQGFFRDTRECFDKDCLACAGRLKAFRRLVKKAFDLGREDTASAPMLCLFGHETRTICDECERDPF